MHDIHNFFYFSLFLVKFMYTDDPKNQVLKDYSLILEIN